MWVERLEIDGFRRLAGRFDFRPGLNLVLGENEAGKSTLHEALVRALFGFSTKERRGESAWRRSRPWDSNRPYRLRALVREARDGRSYRIEWDFDAHTLRLLDALTGADESAHAVGKGKEVRLGEHLLGTDLDNFRGVCSLDQADLTPVRRSDWLTASLQQAVASVAREGAGVAEADAILVGLLADLGYHAGHYTSTAKGRARAVEEERERLRSELERVQGERERVRGLAAELAQATAEAAQLRGRLLVAELDSARRRLEEARRLQREAEDRPASLPDLDLARVDRLRGQLDHVAAEIDTLQRAVAAIRPRVVELQARREELLRRLEELAPYEGVEGSAEAEVREAWAALQLLARRPREEEAEPGGSGLGWRLLCVLTLGLAWLVRRAWRAVRGWIARRALAAAVAREQAEAESRLRAALERAGAAEAPDLAGRAAAYLAACDRGRERAAVAGELAQVEGELAVAAGPERALDRAREERDRLARELDALCAAAGVAVDEVERLRAEAERARRAETAAEALRALLGTDTPVDLERRVATVEARLGEHEREHGAPAGPVADPEGAAEELRALEARISRLEGEIAEAERGLPAPAELEERVQEAEERLARLELLRDAVKVARETLAEAARVTHRAFAPHLNEALARALPRITAGRYKEALVAEDLTVKVRAPETDAFVHPSQLSRATQDGIYLVQRLEIVRLLDPTLGAAPLLLDDPFARFDRRRLRLGLELLADIARDRQVICFSEDPAVEALAAEVCPGLHRIRLDPVG